MSNLTREANGQPCIRCGKTGATVSAHYSGPWQHRLGKGRGIKGNDVGAADLCDECHTWFDEYRCVTALIGTEERELQRLQRSEEFLALCLLTVIRRVEAGKITGE